MKTCLIIAAFNILYWTVAMGICDLRPQIRRMKRYFSIRHGYTVLHSNF